jgi:WD40 repeat protein
VRTWAGHHLGSLYCIAWTHADAACEDALLATGSNDTLLKVARFNRNGEGGSGVVSVSPDKGTIRDVCWLGGWSRPGVGGGSSVHLAASGSGGGFGVCVYDASVLSSAPRSPLVTLQGHAGAVHAIRPWSNDGGEHSQTFITASADGTVRLWDPRAGARAATTLHLSSAGAIAAPGARLGGEAPGGGSPVELHAMCVRAGAGEVAVGCADGTVALVDVAGARMVARERVHDGEIRSLDSLGPLLLSSGFDGAVAVSAAFAGGSTGGSASGGAGGEHLRVLLSRKDHRDRALCARWHPAAPIVVSSSADRSVLSWSCALH